MNLRRVGRLLFRELVQGPKNFIFIFAVIVPLVLSLTVSLLFGALFSEKPRLGLVAGDSQLVVAAAEMDGFVVRQYADEAALRAATESGAVDIGVALPADFDAQVAAGLPTEMTAYVWGESLVKDRAMLVAALAGWVRQIAGQTSPVDIVTTVLGDVELLPWEQRLLPFVVMISIMVGGMMLPASSLVAEKQQRTLTALLVTPATRGEIYVAKGLLGVLLSSAMGLLILALNRALGGNMALMLGVLALAAIFAAEIGVLLGSLVKDINTLFAAVKSMGLFLYAPAILYMFPQIPQWIAPLFPTYYAIQPVIEISQHGATLADVGWQLGVLLALIGLLAGVLMLLAKREYSQA